MKEQVQIFTGGLLAGLGIGLFIGVVAIPMWFMG